jgi:hypothetical protein
VTTLTARLSELAVKYPENKNMATRVTKLLNQSVAEKWERERLTYESKIKKLREDAKPQKYTITKVLTPVQYGFCLEAKVTEFDYSYVGRITIVPVTVVTNGVPAIRWTCDGRGIYITLGGTDENRKFQNAYDDVETAIDKAQKELDAIGEKWIADRQKETAQAQAILDEIDKENK